MVEDVLPMSRTEADKGGPSGFDGREACTAEGAPSAGVAGDAPSPGEDPTRTPKASVWPSSRDEDAIFYLTHIVDQNAVTTNEGSEFQREVTVSMGYLVLNEALLLRLCLKISLGVDKEVLRRDMLNLAIQTIEDFQNFYFLDMLLNMLMEPSLPAALSLSSEDSVILRKVLYDAVILVDYSFYSESWAHSDFTVLSKKLSLVWVLAADHAVQFARATMDEAKAVAYLNAYRESQMVTHLIKWVYSQIGMVHPHTRHEITTPRAFINWLLALEEQGIRVFDQSMSLFRAKAVACVKSEPPQLDLEQLNLNQNRFDLNVASANEDQEMHGQLNNGVPGDHCLMNMKQDGGKKRKEASSGVEESQNKQIKLGIFGFSLSKRDDAEKPVIDISSDDDMDVDKR